MLVKNSLPKDIEKTLYEVLLEEFPQPFYTVIFNDKIKGKYSKVFRQIDITVYHNADKKNLIIIADAKKYKKKLNVRHIEQFIGLKDDIGIKFGIIAPLIIDLKDAFTTGAKNRAKSSGVVLRPIDLNEAIIKPRWKPLARKIFPYDLNYHPELARGLYYLYHGNATAEIDSIENIMYEEWEAFVNYGIHNNYNYTVDFLKIIVNHHNDSGWRFNAIKHLLEIGELDKNEIDQIRKMEKGPEFQELIETVI